MVNSIAQKNHLVKLKKQKIILFSSLPENDSKLDVLNELLKTHYLDEIPGLGQVLISQELMYHHLSGTFLPKGFEPIHDRRVGLTFATYVICSVGANQGWQTRKINQLIEIYEALLGYYSKNHFRNQKVLGLITFTNRLLAKRLGISTRTLQRYLRLLEQMKLIHKTQEGKNKSGGQDCASTPASYMIIMQSDIKNRFLQTDGNFDLGEVQIRTVTLIKSKIYVKYYLKVNYNTQDVLDVDFDYITQKNRCKCLKRAKPRVIKVGKLDTEGKKISHENATKHVSKYYCLVHRWYSGRRCNPVSGKWKVWKGLNVLVKEGEINMVDIPKEKDMQGVMALQIIEEMKDAEDAKDTSPQMVRHICEKFFRFRWTVEDIMHAVYYNPNGEQKVYNLKGVKNLSKFLSYRLTYWRRYEKPDEYPIASISQQKQEELDKQNQVENAKREREKQELVKRLEKLGLTIDDKVVCSHGFVGYHPVTGKTIPTLRIHCDLCLTELEDDIEIIAGLNKYGIDINYNALSRKERLAVSTHLRDILLNSLKDGKCSWGECTHKGGSKLFRSKCSCAKIYTIPCPICGSEYKQKEG